jgi:hypothetical protein
MARSVHITTPIPTLEEFGKSLGLSKRRQHSLLRLVSRGKLAGQGEAARRDASAALGKRDQTRDFRSKK